LKLVADVMGCLEVGSMSLSAWTFAISDAAVGSIGCSDCAVLVLCFVFGVESFVFALRDRLGINIVLLIMTVIARKMIMMTELSPIPHRGFAGGDVKPGPEG